MFTNFDRQFNLICSYFCLHEKQNLQFKHSLCIFFTEIISPQVEMQVNNFFMSGIEVFRKEIYYNLIVEVSNGVSFDLQRLQGRTAGNEKQEMYYYNSYR